MMMTDYCIFLTCMTDCDWLKNVCYLHIKFNSVSTTSKLGAEIVRQMSSGVEYD